MGQVDSSEDVPPGGGGAVFPRPSFVVLVVLLGVEWQIWQRWDVPVWSFFAALVLTLAWDVQVVVGRSQEPPRPLRPLTLTTLAVAVVCTVLVVLSGAPSDRWFLLAWLLPAATALAEKICPHLPNTTLVRIISCLLAVVVVSQLWFIWNAHTNAQTRQERASSFHDRVAQICANTVSRSSGGTRTWIAANESMIAQLQTLTPPDGRTRELTGYLINALRNSEASFRVNDPVKQGEWQQIARQIAGYLYISPSCGVF